MDLVGGKAERAEVYRKKKKELELHSGDIKIRTFATSIYDETLYKAWSSIVHTLIPNAPQISEHLDTFAKICSATEVVLFERTTFLVIAWSGEANAKQFTNEDDNPYEESNDPSQPHPEGLHPQRFEKISELIKGFRLSCTKLHEQFNSLEIRFPTFTALLEVLTTNTYMMLIADPNVQSAALKLNVRLARERFDQLQVGSL
jgi:Ras-related GTP-binding protein A/B